MTRENIVRRLPIGAECARGGGVDFRVWAPKCAQVEIALEGPEHAGLVRAMRAEEGGYFRLFVPEASAGTLYGFRLDGGPRRADPASRAQPDGPHGPSRVIDPSTFRWSDAKFAGVPQDGQVLYEMHIGTFTPEGTWDAAARELEELVRVGITTLEIMPIAEFSGRWGWGYDGVNLFAPTRLYGTPDDARRFVDRAHILGLAVILDVVYNHLGPDGNYLGEFSDTYFSTRYTTDWGPAINYDGEGSAPVREYVLANAAYWIDELHFDGLRLDATQNIYDASKRHVLGEIVLAVRRAGGARATYVVAENEPQEARLVRPPERGGFGLDGIWNDDFHHTAHVALTGRAEAYYSDYGGTVQELLSALKYGFLYQGQRYAWQKKNRGTPAFDVAPSTFVTFLENHDQIANSARGERLHVRSNPARYRALTALLLLGPGTPMLFQGQEFAASSPFLFFADQPGDLVEKIRAGRREFLAQFPSLAAPEVAASLPEPDAHTTFARCTLDRTERTKHEAAYALHRDLLTLRRRDPVFSRAHTRATFDGAVLAPTALALRFRGEDDDRLVLVNLGPDLRLARIPEPLLAAPEGMKWTVLFSTEDPRYGGSGVAPMQDEEGTWRLGGESTLVLRAVPAQITEPAEAR